MRHTGKCSAQDCLRAFTTEEALVGDECYTCSKCKSRRECTKQIAIQRCPKILVIHVKRFSHGAGSRRAKLTTTLTFPVEQLDVEPFCAERTTARAL